MHTSQEAKCTSPASTSIAFARQAQKLSLLPTDLDDERTQDTTAVEARFITPQDSVIETANGERLPAVPLTEAVELNKLRDQVDGKLVNHTRHLQPGIAGHEETLDGDHLPEQSSPQSTSPDANFGSAHPPSRTNPLFPELPLYGPSSFMRNLQCLGFRCTSAILSLTFLGVIVLGSAFTSLPLVLKHIWIRLKLQDPNARRPFYEEEKRRSRIRSEKVAFWKRRKRNGSAGLAGADVSLFYLADCPLKGCYIKAFYARIWSQSSVALLNAGSLLIRYTKPSSEEGQYHEEEYPPTEGGKDPLICDPGYYARRVGLDIEVYKVQTEDGFIIELLHVYDPKETSPASPSHREERGPVVFPKDVEDASSVTGTSITQQNGGRGRYPVLLIHGLLQSAGAYCSNDDDSLAFYICKSGYDVWLGNNRCGFKPQHQLLSPSDPRMWNWNIRQMGVMDLSALTSRVLAETGYEKLGLISHSQGTTETFVALAKEQRPDLGKKISVFCALAPAVYAGPLIGKMYFKFMRIISPGMFRIIFGIHSFIPFMMTMHSYLPGRLYGALGYRVFAFLFNWTDDRWDQGIRDRLFQFSPVYVSAESMRWWLGRECFATQKCILATREEGKQEDEEDDEQEYYYVHGAEDSTEHMIRKNGNESSQDRGARAWYDDQVPPFAVWVAGSDELVDGRRLLRRFERNREPHVRVVHSRVIEEYEHLDVIWAIDSVDKVAKEIREVLWKTVPTHVRESCRVPKGCEEIQVWEP